MRCVFAHYHRDRRRKCHRPGEANEDIGECVLEAANVLFDAQANFLRPTENFDERKGEKESSSR